jgi:hypothetical protein
MKKIVILISILVMVEFIMAGLLSLGANHQKQIFNKIYPNNDFKSIDPAMQEKMISEVELVYGSSVYRGIDLVVIAYHIPALATIGYISGNDYLSRYIYMPANVIFYFLCINTIFAIRNRRKLKKKILANHSIGRPER